MNILFFIPVIFFISSCFGMQEQQNHLVSIYVSTEDAKTAKHVLSAPISKDGMNILVLLSSSAYQQLSDKNLPAVPEKNLTRIVESKKISFDHRIAVTTLELKEKKSRTIRNEEFARANNDRFYRTFFAGTTLFFACTTLGLWWKK